MTVKRCRFKAIRGALLGKEGTVDVTVTIRDNQPENVTISGRGHSVSCRMGHYFLIFVRPANPRGKKLFSRLRMGIKCSHYRGQLRLGKTVLYIIYAETKLLLK